MDATTPKVDLSRYLSHGDKNIVKNLKNQGIIRTFSNEKLRKSLKIVKFWRVLQKYLTF